MGNLKKRVKRIKGLTLQFLPYSEIESLGTSERIQRVLKVVLGNHIVVIQGRLKPDEEVRLIEDTMAMVGHVKGFKGIELAVIGGNEDRGFFSNFKHNLAKALVGDTEALTIIGPASFVKEIKKDPRKIELMFK